MRGAAALAEIRELRARIIDKDAQLADARETIDDLRRRLDRADERLTALLTDQRVAAPAPARRSWWSWGRKLIMAGMVWFAAYGPALADGNKLLEDCLKPVGGPGVLFAWHTLRAWPTHYT